MTSGSVTTTGGTAVAWWFGAGRPYQGNHTATPGAGWTLLDCYGVDDPSGYVQACMAAREVGAGTHAVTWTHAPVQGDYLDFDDVVAKFEKMMDWLASTYVTAMNVIHYMHDKYAYERLEMALHDYAPLRTMAFGMAGLSVAGRASYANVSRL